MTKEDKDCLNLLKKEVDATVKGLEEAAHGDYETFADYLDDNFGIKIRIDGNFHYLSTEITFGIGGPGIWFDTANGTVYGKWGADLEFSKMVDFETCDAVDDYFEEYYTACR